MGEIVGKDYLEGQFIKEVQQRGAEIIKLRGQSSAASAANAICEHIKNWILGTKEDQIVSMAVSSKGNPYGISENLIFSFPVKCLHGKWSIVSGLDLSSGF